MILIILIISYEYMTKNKGPMSEPCPCGITIVTIIYITVGI